MTAQPDILVAQDGTPWAYEASQLIQQIGAQAIQARGRFLLALSGGSTPKTLYRTWAAPEWRGRFDWERIVFLFGDERCVPPDHPDSNYAMAEASLFRPLEIKPDAILRMRGEQSDAAVAARDYEQRLRTMMNCPAPDFPRIDLVLLGLGDDGHTASLFPGTAALHDTTRAVTVGHSPKGVPSRLTLTLGVINWATVVLFLVVGAGKASVVRAVLEPRTREDRVLPAAMVNPRPGRLVWMLDRSAAGQLTRGR